MAPRSFQPSPIRIQIRSLLSSVRCSLSSSYKQRLVEDIVQTIYLWEQKERKHRPHEYIAKALHFTPEWIETMIRYIETLGLYSSLRENLTTQGTSTAVKLARKHQLIETYLSLHSGYSAQEWHKKAHKWEHTLSDKKAKALARQLHHPRIDPLGDPIPTLYGEVSQPTSEAVRLSEISQFPALLQVVRFESEAPDDVTLYYSLGVLPQTRIIAVRRESEDQVIALQYGAPISIEGRIARNLFVQPIHAPVSPEEEEILTIPLSELKRGEKATILCIAPSARGVVRRRLMDLGFVPGSSVSVDLISPLGNPIAFRIRETTIALRKDQASFIRVARNT